MALGRPAEITLAKQVVMLIMITLTIPMLTKLMQAMLMEFIGAILVMMIRTIK